MSAIFFGHSSTLFWLWAAAPVLLLAWLSHRRTLSAARAFAGQRMLGRILPPLRGSDAALRIGLFIAGGALAILALSRPAWDFETVTARASGLDIVVALDVSRSMLADDGGESRLDRARSMVRRLSAGLGNHRLGLVAFAGEVLPACPLTLDHAHFQDVLGRLTPGMVGRGGTRLGPALDAAGGILDSSVGRDRVLVLLTDAGDQDSFPMDSAERLKKQGVRVVAVGVGRTRDPSEPLVIDGQVVRDRKGQAVLARVNGELLEKIATATSGVYVPPGSGAELSSIFERYIAPLSMGDHGEYQERHPRERFTVFLAPAVLLLIVQAGLAPYRRKRRGAA